MPDLQRDWDVISAVDWIAFRGSPPVLLRHSEQQDDAAPVTKALRARAIGNPRTWRPDPGTVVLSAWRTRALVRRWMRAEGLSAAEMLQKASSNDPKWLAVMDAGEHHCRRLHSLHVLNIAVARADIQAWARNSPTWIKPDSPHPRCPVPSHYVDNERQIGLDDELRLRDGNNPFISLKDRGVRTEQGHVQLFYDVAFRITDVRQCWPAPRTSAAADDIPDGQLTSPPAPTPVAPILKSGIPGRPSCADIAKKEMRRRFAEGLICTKVAEEARALAQYLTQLSLTTDLLADLPSPRGLENAIRDLYRELQGVK